MSEPELKLDHAAREDHETGIMHRLPESSENVRRRMRILPILVTLLTIIVAVPLCWAMWNVYMDGPWTRDGTVRAYIDTMAPEVAGRIVQLPVTDNQYVHKGDLLMLIDPTDYTIAVHMAEAAVAQDRANALNLEREAARRRQLNDLAVTVEQQQTYTSGALAAEATLQQAEAGLDQARVNLERTQIRSPANGWVTNLLVQLGDYANVGQNELSVVDANSYWIDAYFQETNLGSIHEGDPAEVKLMGYSQIVHGHVASIARAIDVPNAQPNLEGVATVNPIFTWVRLAQRVPVRIHIDHVPAGVRLVAGTTATVQIDPRANPWTQRALSQIF